LNDGPARRAGRLRKALWAGAVNARAPAENARRPSLMRKAILTQDARLRDLGLGLRLLQQGSAIGVLAEAWIDKGQHGGERRKQPCEACCKTTLRNQPACFNADLRTAQRAADGDGRAQADKTRLLRMPSQLEIDAFVLEIDHPLAADLNDLRVEYELAQIHHAALRFEVSDGATDVGLRAVVDQKCARHVDAEQLGEGLADLAARNNESKCPVGG